MAALIGAAIMGAILYGVLALYEWAGKDETKLEGWTPQQPDRWGGSNSRPASTSDTRSTSPRPR
jgi:hypothetical protein